jgi:hypothetical protein
MGRGRFLDKSWRDEGIQVAFKTVDAWARVMSELVCATHVATIMPLLKLFTKDIFRSESRLHIA